MFTIEEFKTIRRCIELSEQSATRLANRSGQAANVVEAYLLNLVELGALRRKVQAELDKLSVPVKK